MSNVTYEALQQTAAAALVSHRFKAVGAAAAAEPWRSAARARGAVVNVADHLFDRSRGAARTWPKGFAEILELLIWAMDDNGAEILAAVERWLQSDDLDRVRVALEVEDVFNPVRLNCC